MKFDKSIKLINISITNKCNFKCSYCYKLDILNTKNDVEINTIDKIVNAFTCDVKPSIVFFGGEPMLNEKLIIESIKKYGSSIHWQIITNGSIDVNNLLLSIKDIPDIKNNLLFIVSYDGTKDNLRGNRCTMDYNMITKNTFNILDNGFKVHLNPTYCHQNINNMKLIYLEGKENYKLHNNLSYGLNFSKRYDMTMDELNIYVIDVKSNLRYILDSVIEDLNNNDNPYIPRYISALTWLIKNNIRIHTHCENKFRYSIDVEENIYRCNICSIKINNKIGNINNDYLNDESVFSIDGTLDNLNSLYNSMKDKDCGYKCFIEPQIYKILLDEFNRFINMIDFDKYKDIFNYSSDLYPAGFCLGTITDSEAFDKVI